MHRNRHPELIKARMRMTGTTVAEFARMHGVSRQSVSKAFRERSQNIQRLIADLLKEPIQNIWPEWYDEQGHPRPSIRSIPIRHPDDTAKGNLMADGGEQ